MNNHKNTNINNVNTDKEEMRHASEETQRELFENRSAYKSIDALLNEEPLYENREIAFKYKDDNGNDVNDVIYVMGIPTNLKALLKTVPADILVKCFTSWNISHTILSKARNAKGALKDTLFLPSQPKEKSETIKLKLNNLTPAQIEALKAAGVL